MSVFGSEQLVGIDLTDGLVLSVSYSPISYWSFLFLFSCRLLFRLIVAITHFPSHHTVLYSRNEVVLFGFWISRRRDRALLRTSIRIIKMIPAI